jgi:hypothetical protein
LAESRGPDSLVGTARRRGSLALCLAALACALGCALGCGGGRDFIPETHEVHGVTRTPHDTGGYEYIAKRPLGVVGLAEARGMDPADVARVVDHLADSLEACSEDLAKNGKLVNGAARIAAEVSSGGTPVGLALKVAPGSAVMANALLCFITPFKLTSFPAVSPETPARGLAIEATWGGSLVGASSIDGG